MVYVLRVKKEQHSELERLADSAGTLVVPVESKAARKDEMVLIQHNDAVTHVAMSESAGKKLTLSEIRPLPRPLQFLELPSLIPRRLVAHALRVFRAGGRLPPKTGEAILSALAHHLRV